MANAEEVQRQLAALIAEVGQLRVDRDSMRVQLAAQARTNEGLDRLVAVVQIQAAAVEQLARKRDRVSLIDSKGLGRPKAFGGKEDEYLPWSVKTKNYMIGVYPELQRCLEWASEFEGEITDDVCNHEFADVDGAKT